MKLSGNFTSELSNLQFDNLQPREHDWQMDLNPDKCRVIHMAMRKHPWSIIISMGVHQDKHSVKNLNWDHCHQGPVMEQTR